MEFSIGTLAAQAGVSTRTLRHYDAVGLLQPSGRSDGGYRLYGSADAIRLRRIVVYRELGFTLPDIAEILGDPAMHAVDHLRRQHQLINEQISHLETMRSGVESEFAAGAPNTGRDPAEPITLYSDGQPMIRIRPVDVEQNWAQVEAWKEIAQRLLTYRSDELDAMVAAGTRIEVEMTRLFTAGVPAGSVAAMDVAEAHRIMISSYFYELDREHHRLFAESEGRPLTTGFDEELPGLGDYVLAAIIANAAR